MRFSSGVRCSSLILEYMACGVLWRVRAITRVFLFARCMAFRVAMSARVHLRAVRFLV